ncbi:hypothetical protein BCV72DRAFT_326225 [Rhizopus microsporus var. microsporus]|uniref:Uncharacterized protein n=1 Tax=Rhizopus microsporus var. microsporus TaxID=86635 RepID=A0A1X0RHB7_RHIZD|nr:hypothetical protein BCV72DRAFT_326225 [Rhizopus microsporus var. microsporus]
MALIPCSQVRPSYLTVTFLLRLQNKSVLEYLFRRTAKDYEENAKQYNDIQCKILAWCELQRHDPFNPSPAVVINYLAYGYHYLSWLACTCHTYRAAILNLYDKDKAIIVDDLLFISSLAR